MNALRTSAVILFALGTASCAGGGTPEHQSSTEYYLEHPVELITTDSYNAQAAPPMDPGRKVSEQDCTKPYDLQGANLRCK